MERKKCTVEKNKNYAENTGLFLDAFPIRKNIQNDQHKNRKQGILDKCEQEYEKMCVEIVRKGCYDSTVKKVRT